MLRWFYRTSDKIKKGPVHKKGSVLGNGNSPPPGLQSERTILHEKTLQYDKMVNNTKKMHKRADDISKPNLREDGGFTLPELKNSYIESE